jgi:hypothetical protein
LSAVDPLPSTPPIATISEPSGSRDAWLLRIRTYSTSAPRPNTTISRIFWYATTRVPTSRTSDEAAEPAATTVPVNSSSGMDGAVKGITGRALNSVSLLNCKATCDTRIKTSAEDALGSEGVG